MKTPYDPVVRLKAREIEDLRDSLRREMMRIALLTEDAAALAVRVREECTQVQGDTTVRTDQWMRARKAQANQIAEARIEAEAGLAQLRDKAMTAYGKLRAAEKAAGVFVERALAEAERKAQSEADDLSNARRLFKLRSAMRARLMARRGEYLDA